MDSGRRVLCLLPGTVGDIENQPQEIWRVGRSVSYLSPSGSVQIANNLLPLAVCRWRDIVITFVGLSICSLHI